MKKLTKKSTKKLNSKKGTRKPRRNPNDYVPSVDILLKLCKKHGLIITDSKEYEIVLRTEDEFYIYDYSYYYGVTINIRHGVTIKGFFVINGNKGFVGHKEENITDDLTLQKSFDSLIKKIKDYLKR